MVDGSSVEEGVAYAELDLQVNKVRTNTPISYRIAAHLFQHITKAISVKYHSIRIVNFISYFYYRVFRIFSSSTQ